MARWFLTRKVPAYVVVTLAIVVLMPFLFPRLIFPDSSRRDDGLGIQALITGVKDELTKVEKTRRESGEAPLFELKDFDLEISFVVRTSTKQSAGANYQVLTVDSALETGSERIQKLRLHMTAIAQPAKDSISPSPGPLADPQDNIRTLTPTPLKQGGHR